VPNGENAEKYLNVAFYDSISLNAINEFKKMGFLKETIFDTVLGDWLKSSNKTDETIRYIEVKAE